MGKNILLALPLLLIAMVTSPAVIADNGTLPECAVNAAQASDVELALFQALMHYELGEPPRAVPCTFYERSAAALSSSLSSQKGDRWAAVSLFLRGRVVTDDPAVKRVRAFYENN
ncbi:TPA: hypothetical protein NKO30_006199 [Pseudomonas aeruginosa]|nr:hypothetical protein [Pseudomonas aeruginosa]